MQPEPLIVGVDWADRALQVHYELAGEVHNHAVAHTPAEVLAWLERLRRSGRRLVVACERSHGWLVQLLLGIPDVEYYAINPASLDHYRKSRSPSRAKSDAVDAEYLHDLAAERYATLSPLSRSEPLIERLDRLNRQRRQLVELRVQMTNRLGEHLKQCYPGFLRVCGEKLDSPLAAAMLTRFPCQRRLAKAAWASVERVLRDHGVRLLEPRRQAHAAMRLVNDDPLLEADETMVTGLMRQQVALLNRQIDQLDKRLTAVAREHPRYALFRALPGAGAALAPRLLVVFARYGELAADRLTACVGTAPIIISSGRTSRTLARHAKPAFDHQTLV